MRSSTGAGWVTRPSFIDDPRVPLAENAVILQGLRTIASLRSTCKRESETLARVGEVRPSGQLTPTKISRGGFKVSSNPSPIVLSKGARNSDPHRGQELRISLNDSPLQT